MKTAISIPDNLFVQAEHTAKSMGMSRSEFFSLAVRLFLESKKEEYVTEQLNKTYEDVQSGLDDRLAKMQFSSIPKEEW